MPPPYTLSVAAPLGCAVCLSGTVSPVLVSLLPLPACAEFVLAGNEFPRTKRCLSSGSSSLSSPSVSNASASVASTLASLSCDIMDDAREWKDGGGELGTASVWLAVGAVGVPGSFSSWVFTCNKQR
jgi:hypothetical protein